MAGVDNILKEILQEAQTKADGLLSEAKSKADEILQSSAQADEKMAEDSRRAALKGAADLEERAKSQSALRIRQAVLKTKQDIIDEVIDQAYTKLSTQGDAEYFGMAEKLLEKAVRPGDGEICFNAEDLKRVPASFKKNIEKIAAEKGGTLKIGETPVKIRNGFILAYGGIEENCSLDAIFSEKKEKLRDLVNSILW